MKIVKADTSDIDRKINTCYSTVRKLEDKKRTLLRNQSVICQDCKKEDVLSNYILLQTHWYTEPSGCMEGDHWNYGEKNLICHGCGMRYRFLNDKSFWRTLLKECSFFYSKVHEYEHKRYNHREKRSIYVELVKGKNLATRKESDGEKVNDDQFTAYFGIKYPDKFINIYE